MEIKFADTFLPSLKKVIRSETWWYKIWDAIRYDIWKFFGNLWRFRKSLWSFRRWDSSYNLRIFRDSLEQTANSIEKYGLEVPEHRLAKVASMRRAIKLSTDHIEDNYIEMAETELGKEVVTKWDFKDMEGHPGFSELLSIETEEEAKDNEEIFTRCTEIEASQWKELWTILEGNKDILGSDMRSWWD